MIKYFRIKDFCGEGDSHRGGAELCAPLDFRYTTNRAYHKYDETKAAKSEKSFENV